LAAKTDTVKNLAEAHTSAQSCKGSIMDQFKTFPPVIISALLSCSFVYAQPAPPALGAGRTLESPQHVQPAIGTVQTLESEHLGHVGQAIITGKTVGAGEQELRGLVTLNGGSCSGVLIANDWVMTAGHCVSSARPPAPVRVSLNGVNRNGDATYQFGGGLGPTGLFLNPSYGPDLALIHLSQPFIIAGATTGFVNRLYEGTPASLNAKLVASYGQGISIYAQPGTPPLPPTGAGTWRAADLTVSNVSATTYRISPAPSGNPNLPNQITAFGDSGGPAFIWENSIPFLVGIQSTSNPICNNSTPLTCQQTVTGILFSTATSVPAVRDWIAAVLKSRWEPTATSTPVMVQLAEVKGTSGDFTDANNVGWAQAARSASKMCYNRGFAGGHFDGHQDVAKGTYGIQCSGVGTQFNDMFANAMDSRWAFSDINNVSWAQANRVAERFCAAQNKGFAGGHFNGNMAPGVVLVPAKFGIFCYKDGAQWFDANDTELAATGFGFSAPNLDDVAWAQADRAAVGYCRGKGFSGGFMNGQHVPGKYGVVCQK
jgi:Trypsin